MVAALGYEARATHAAKLLSDSTPSKVAFAFKQRQVLHFDANRDWFEAAQFEIVEADDGPAFETEAERVILSALGSRPESAICVDISSFNRQRLAFLVTFLLRRVDRPIAVDFVYSPSTFAPPQQDENPISVCEPVTPDLASWPVGADLPSVLICGLGYEPDRALGVAEYLDTAGSWLFFPTGPVKEFIPEVQKANAELLEGFPPDRLIYYEVARPFNTFVRLESLVAGLIERARPVLVPLGPKPFALASLVVGVAHSPHVSVWRVSGGQKEEPIDRVPEGSLVGLSVSVLALQPDADQARSREAVST